MERKLFQNKKGESFEIFVNNSNEIIVIIESEYGVIEATYTFDEDDATPFFNEVKACKDILDGQL